MNPPVFLNRIMLRNYKSIGFCEVRLGRLTYLVGANGAGKSNFLDALHFVRDGLNSSLDNALSSRGGVNEVRRRSGGHPNHFGLRLDFTLPDGQQGLYAFDVGALKSGGYEVLTERCQLGWLNSDPHFHVAKGVLVSTSETTFPAITKDRLALVSASGSPVFRPAYDALSAMGFYNLNPTTMREPQKPQDGRMLKSVGENLVSVISHLERFSPQSLGSIQTYLQSVVPLIQGVERKQIGPLETLEFRQAMAGSAHPWHFASQSMSDGTLRALGVLTALFQEGRDSRPTLVGIEEPETALHPAASAALRAALTAASQQVQVVVTSHSTDLLDDSGITADQLLSVISEGGETKIAGLDEASRKMLAGHLFSPGELLRLNQLAPDRVSLAQQMPKQISLFDIADR